MSDRQKVIKGLESCIANNCRDCPYPCYCEYADDWPHELHKDTLELLKEQEVANVYKCPHCGTWVSAENVVRCKDCKYCGSEIRDGIEFAKCELKHNWMPQADWFCADGERK